MAIILKNSNYNGEVLEQILVLASTGNELVEKGLIRIEPDVTDKFSIPRIKTGKMLRKRVEQPTDSDGKGDFEYSEVTLTPQEFMAFTTFNPKSFEKIWRKWQPKGNLVFSELPPEAQNVLLAEMAKTIKFELGDHMINGVFGDSDTELFNGIVTRIMSNNSRIVVDPTGLTTMLGKLKAVKAAIPLAMRSNPGLRIVMSTADFDQYDEELTQQPNKGADYTTMNVPSYKGIKIESLANWPSGLIIATICGMDNTTNMWGATSLVDDSNVIQIDKLTNSGERYFFKMLMKMDTNVAFGEECIVLDARSGGGVIDSIEVTPEDLIFPAEGSDQAVVVTATSAYTVGAAPVGFTAVKNEWGLMITAAANAGETAKSGSITLSLTGTAETAVINLSQPAPGA